MSRPRSADDRRIVKLHDAGLSADEIAGLCGLHRATVFRALRRARPGRPAAEPTLAGPAPPAPPVDGELSEGTGGGTGPLSAPKLPPNLTVRAVLDDRGCWRVDERPTRTVSVDGAAVELDGQGRVYCAGHGVWMPLSEAVMPGHIVPAAVRRAWWTGWRP